MQVRDQYLPLPRLKKTAARLQLKVGKCPTNQSSLFERAVILMPVAAAFFLALFVTLQRTFAPAFA